MEPVKKHFFKSILFACVSAIAGGFFLLAIPGHGAILYKSYVVKYDRGQDILCDPYIVQKGDWVYKIFRQKGEISAADFQEFLGIFERLNPHIRDINRIRPFQSILIPIKKIEPEAFSDQAKGIVTIPFVTISKIEDILPNYATPYDVEKGDYISKLIVDRFGAVNTQSYREGIKLFKAINPAITDLNRIYIGQRLMLPDPAMQNEPWYESLFDGSGNLKKELEGSPVDQPESLTTDIQVEIPSDNLAKAADILNAKLLRQGTYFFPRAGQDDFELDLSRFPVIEMSDGTRIILMDKAESSKINLDFLKSYWKSLQIVEIEKSTPIDELIASIFTESAKQVSGNRISFEDNGLEVTIKAEWIKMNPSTREGAATYLCISVIDEDGQYTSDAIKRYLDQHGIIIKEVIKKRSSNKADQKEEERKNEPFVLANVTTIAPTDRKTFVFDLLQILGYSYFRDISISFPYAGIQVKTTSNLVSTGNGKDFLIDFGDLYGDAVQEIKKTGLDTVQLKKDDNTDDIIKKVLDALQTPYIADPIFFAAKRDETYNTELRITGYLLNQAPDEKTLISRIPLHNRVLQFLNEEGVKVVLTGLVGA